MVFGFLKNWRGRKEKQEPAAPGRGGLQKTAAIPAHAPTVAAKPTPPKPAVTDTEEPGFRIGQTVRVPGLGDFTVHDTKGGKGKSGMGLVYIVLDVSSMTPYAVKTFQKWCLD